MLDTALGKPAAGVSVRLQRVAESASTTAGGTEIGRASTDDDGRIAALGPANIEPGTYRLVFDTGAYFRAQHAGQQAFFPAVAVTFTVHDPRRHHHVPLLLSPFGYSTYRGS